MDRELARIKRELIWCTVKLGFWIVMSAVSFAALVFVVQTIIEEAK